MKTISGSVLSIKKAIKKYDDNENYEQLWNSLENIIKNTIVLSFEDGWIPYVQQMPRKGYHLIYRDAGHNHRGHPLEYVKEYKLTKDELKYIKDGRASICSGSGQLFSHLLSDAQEFLINKKEK